MLKPVPTHRLLKLNNRHVTYFLCLLPCCTNIWVLKFSIRFSFLYNLRSFWTRFVTSPSAFELPILSRLPLHLRIYRAVLQHTCSVCRGWALWLYLTFWPLFCPLRQLAPILDAKSLPGDNASHGTIYEALWSCWFFIGSKSRDIRSLSGLVKWRLTLFRGRRCFPTVMDTVLFSFSVPTLASVVFFARLCGPRFRSARKTHIFQSCYRRPCVRSFSRAPSGCCGVGEWSVGHCICLQVSDAWLGVWRLKCGVRGRRRVSVFVEGGSRPDSSKFKLS